MGVRCLLVVPAVALAELAVLASLSVTWVALSRRPTRRVALIARHAERKPVRCPACGQAQRADCDGKGALIGGAGQFWDWLPVKAYRPCPRFKGSYQRRGQTPEG